MKVLALVIQAGIWRVVSRSIALRSSGMCIRSSRHSHWDHQLSAILWAYVAVAAISLISQEADRRRLNLPADQWAGARPPA